MPFQFLSYDQLSQNMVALLEKVLKKHADTNTKLTGKREAQVELLGSVVDRLKLMGRETVYSNSELIALAKQEITQIVALSKQINELKQTKQLTEIQTELLARLEAEKREHEKTKNALIKLTKLNNNNVPSEEQNLKLISEEQRRLIVTGALLAIKKQIEQEYSGASNRVLSYVVKNDPSNSELYKGINEAIGVSPENVLDAESEKKALLAYNQFVGVVEELKHFDRSKLRKTKTVEKDHLYIYDVNKEFAENSHGDQLLDTPEEKERYRRYVASQEAHETFMRDVKPQVESFDKANLNKVQTEEKVGKPFYSSKPDHAVLPNGQRAKNNVIDYVSDPESYMSGITLPPDRNGDSVKLNEADQVKAYQQANRFFGGVKQAIDAKPKLNHVTPSAKERDPNTVVYTKRF